MRLTFIAKAGFFFPLSLFAIETKLPLVEDLVFCYSEAGAKACQLSEIPKRGTVTLTYLDEESLMEEKLKERVCTVAKRVIGKPVNFIFRGKGLAKNGPWVMEWADANGATRGREGISASTIIRVVNQCLEATHPEGTGLAFDGEIYGGERWDFEYVQDFRRMVHRLGAYSEKDPITNVFLSSSNGFVLRDWGKRHKVSVKFPEDYSLYDLPFEPEAVPVVAGCKEFWRELKQVDFAKLILDRTPRRLPLPVTCNETPIGVQTVHVAYLMNCRNSALNWDDCSREAAKYHATLVEWEWRNRPLQFQTDAVLLAERLFWHRTVAPYSSDEGRREKTIEIAERLFALRPEQSKLAWILLDLKLSAASLHAEKYGSDPELWARAKQAADTALKVYAGRPDFYSVPVRDIAFYAKTEGGKPDLFLKEYEKYYPELVGKKDLSKIPLVAGSSPPAYVWLTELLK